MNQLEAEPLEPEYGRTALVFRLRRLCWKAAGWAEGYPGQPEHYQKRFRGKGTDQKMEEGYQKRPSGQADGASRWDVGCGKQGRCACRNAGGKRIRCSGSENYEFFLFFFQIPIAFAVSITGSGTVVGQWEDRRVAVFERIVCFLSRGNADAAEKLSNINY